MIPLDEVEQQWQTEFGLFDVRNLAKFYGITKDLFSQSEDVVLDTWLDVAFDDVKIHRGNIVAASQVSVLQNAHKEEQQKQIHQQKRPSNSVSRFF